MGRLVRHSPAAARRLPDDGGSLLRVRFSVLLIPRPADSGHGRRLTQAHVAVVLDVILQPAGYARTASARRKPSHGGVRVSTFFGIPISIGLAAIPATKFVEQKRKRERDTPADISGFSRTHRAKQGADTEEKNQDFFHRAQP
jgi:hypothetical protein